MHMLLTHHPNSLSVAAGCTSVLSLILVHVTVRFFVFRFVYPTFTEAKEDGASAQVSQDTPLMCTRVGVTVAGKNCLLSDAAAVHQLVFSSAHLHTAALLSGLFWGSIWDQVKISPAVIRVVSQLPTGPVSAPALSAFRFISWNFPEK